MIGEHNTQPTHDEAVAKLRELIKAIPIAMMTTATPEGHLRSRPMRAMTEGDFSGELWFFTRDDSGKVEEVQAEHQVNLAFSHNERDLWVSVSGRANLVHDPEKAKQFWNPALKAWFPDGLDDPKLALLRVSVEEAEYWDTPSSTFVHIAGFLKAVTTGKPYHPGENAKLDLAQ